MPIYEYRCNQCGTIFSRLYRSIRAAEEGPAPACPACSSADVQRLIRGAAVLGEPQESSAEESSAPKPPRLFGRKELNERLRQDRNRASVARADE